MTSALLSGRNAAAATGRNAWSTPSSAAAMSGRSDLPVQGGRHSQVWLTERGWLEAVAMASAVQRPHLQRWAAHDWPAVIRRRDVDAQTDEVCLGVALPPDAEGGKLRIALRIGTAGVRELQSPLSVAAVVSHAPTPWQGALRNLHDDVAAGGLSVRVYGSLALQALTGQAYLRPTSDIDLLFAPLDCAGLQQGMQLLQTHASVL